MSSLSEIPRRSLSERASFGGKYESQLETLVNAKKDTAHAKKKLRAECEQYCEKPLVNLQNDQFCVAEFHSNIRRAKRYFDQLRKLAKTMDNCLKIKKADCFSKFEYYIERANILEKEMKLASSTRTFCNHMKEDLKILNAEIGRHNHVLFPNHVVLLSEHFRTHIFENLDKYGDVKASERTSRDKQKEFRTKTNERKKHQKSFKSRARQTPYQ